MFDEVKKEVEQAGGVKTFPLERLRDLYGKPKLGRFVREGISNNLAQAGLGHYPKELPQYYWDTVRVYSLGGAVAKLLEAAETVGENYDDVLREAVSNNAAKIVAEIRELVCK